MNNSIEPFIHRKIVVLEKGFPAHVAAQAMCEKKIGCVLISSGHGKILGILTDRDLVCRAIAQGHDINIPVGYLLTDRELFWVSPQASIVDALRLMEEHGIRRIPVIRKIGKKEHCEGLITFDDLVVARRVSPDQLSRILRKQVKPSGAFRKFDRSKARRDQTYGNFMRRVRRATGLETGRAEAFLVHVLATLVQRLPPSGGEQFLSQLPGVLQDNLFTFPTGPNKKLTAAKLIKNLQAEFDLTEARVEKLVKTIWKTMRTIIKSGELDDVLTQLPRDFAEALETEVPYAPTEAAGVYFDYYSG